MSGSDDMPARHALLPSGLFGVERLDLHPKPPPDDYLTTTNPADTEVRARRADDWRRLSW
jgi:hypothetical protein